MRNKFILLILAFGLTYCASSVIKENATGTPSVQVSNKKIAEERFIDGTILEAKGQYSEAITEYLEALKFDPQPGIHYALAKNYYRLNKLAPAKIYSEKASAKELGNVEYLTLQAAIYSASHLDDSAAVTYNKIIRLDSTNVTAYFNLAQINEQKKPSTALSLYKKILDLTGPEWSVLVRIADLNERMGNVKETVRTVEELIKLNPSDMQLKKLLIDSYIKTKEYDKAIAQVDESLASYPDDLSLIELKGKALFQQNKWKDASNEYMKLIKSKDIGFVSKVGIGSLFFNEAEKDSANLDLAKQIFQEVNKDSSDWQVNASLGEIEMREHNDSSAIQYFKTASQLAEWNPQVWIRLGGLLFDTKKYKEAIQYMSKASEKFPNEFAVNLIYGLSLSAENEHLKAKDALEKALKINPNDVNTLGAMGYTLNQLKEDDKALEFLHKALAVEPNNLQVLSIIAQIYETKKDYNVSDSLYTHALAIDSANALLLNNYAYSLAERKIRLDEALTMSKKAIKKEPRNASYLDTIGWIYFRLGDYKKAKLNIEDAAKMENKNATILDHVGDVYFKLGDKSKANDYWKKAFEADSSKKEIRKKFEKGEL